ncbi:MAG: hypothetical protein AB8U25_00280 [Rickettsiales endosymbiont of Dermacentor nuttalli]
MENSKKKKLNKKALALQRNLLRRKGKLQQGYQDLGQEELLKI